MSATVGSMGLPNTASCGWQESQTSSLSFILLSKSAILAHEGISMSFRPCFLPPLSISPHQFRLPLHSFPLYFCLCPLLLFSCPSERVDVGQSQHHSSAADSCSLWPAPANLDEWQKGQGEASLPPWTSQSYRLSLMGDFWVIRVSLLTSSGSWMSYSQNIIIFISLCPRFVPLGTGWRGRFLCKPVGQSLTDDLQRAGFWAWCP